MIAIIHTKDDHHYIIENVECFEVLTPKGIIGTQIPEDECQQGFRFEENTDDTDTIRNRTVNPDTNNTYSTASFEED